MSDSTLTTKKTPQRLCAEIQLFDLCELDSCKYKQGRFCIDADLILKFEEISEEEISQPECYISEENDDAVLDDEDEFNDYDIDEDDYDEDESEE